MQDKFNQLNELDSYIEEVNAYYEGPLSPYYVGMEKDSVTGVLILDEVEEESVYGRIFTDDSGFLKEVKDLFSTFSVSNLWLETPKELPEISGLQFDYAEYMMTLLPEEGIEFLKKQKDLKVTENITIVPIKDQDRSFYEMILKTQYDMSEDEASERFHSLLTEENMQGYLVYADDTDLVGTGSCYEGDTFITLFDLTIMPEYQNQGYGRAMIYQLLKERVIEKKKCLLQVTSSNTPAFHLYQSIGFKITQQQIFYVLEV